MHLVWIYLMHQILTSIHFKKQEIMKKQRLLFIATLLCGLLFVFNGCSKDEETTPEANKTEAPVLATKTAEVPQAMTESSDPYAQEACMYINYANMFTGFAGMMTPPPESGGTYKSTLENPWVYTWSYNDSTNNYTFTLTVEQTTDKYTWNFVIDGIVDGYVLNNFVYMEAWETLDEKSGEFTMYDWEPPETTLTVNWSTDDNNVYTLYFSESENQQINITVNPDNTGEIIVYEWVENDWQIFYQATWDAVGHGEYWEYENGEVSNHGTW